MVYCAKCGEKNEDTAKFCNKCGSSLTGTKKDIEKNMENRCEEECSGGKDSGHGWRIFWGLVIIIFGIWIIFELVLKNLADNITELAWINEISFPFWWVIGAIFGLLIIITGIRIILKNK